MVELRDRAAVATFFCTAPFAPGQLVQLDAGEVHHASVRRIAVGSVVRLVDGAGARAAGTLVRLSRSQAVVEVTAVEHVPPLPAIHLLVPVADRDRMLWLAEKATEFGVASWRPVLWRRSRSVTPRGEGVTFQRRVLARMTGALTQSGGAWLPALFPDATPERALAACATGQRWLLDEAGATVDPAAVVAPISLAVGPEGGLEADERDALLASGFHAVHLGPLTLRFETAALAGVAVARALASTAESDRD